VKINNCCKYCGHSAHPPDEGGNTDHVVCAMQAMIDEHWNPGE
jgi:hypothetical protein|tara:strand:- start:809 stop:937 length:129 start_codon:yes stop_codon:yes gene_type:complete